MKPRTRLRLVALVPGLFALGGAAFIRTYWQFQPYVPMRGLAAGIVILAAGSVAVAQLWRAARSSPALTAVSGGCFLAAAYAWAWLSGAADMVNATGDSEPPSFLWLHAPELVLATIAILTIGASLIARRAVRDAAE
jgi:hypothetical protein